MSRVLLLFILLLATSAGCQTHNFAQRGAALGGLTGGGFGAAIGELAADEPLVGAAVGSAVGALAGASVGSGLDEVDARNDARLRQAVYAQSARGTSLQEIVSMSDSGLSDQIISRHVQTHGFSGPLDAADLIALRRQGVSDAVIGELQAVASQPVRLAQAQTDLAPRPVVVEERIHTVPVRPWRYRRGHPYPPHGGRPDFHWGISFGH